MSRPVHDDHAVERRLLSAGGRVLSPSTASARQGCSLDTSGNPSGRHQADPSAA